MIPLVTTFGGSLSNAYVSLSDANTFLASTFFSPEWDKVPKADREKALLTATRSLDQKNWAGGRFYTDQSLEFPRSLIQAYPRGTNPSSFNVEWRDMKRRVEEAASIQAVWEVLRQKEVDYRFIQSAGVTSISQGGGNTNTSVSFSGYAQVLHPDSRALLKQWRSSKKVFRG